MKYFNLFGAVIKVKKILEMFQIPVYLRILLLILLWSTFLILVESKYISWHFNPVSANTLHYFFSALSQSMAALFALFGMFAIYRMQMEENRKHGLISNCKSRASRWYFGYVPDGITTWNDSEFLMKLELAIKEKEELQKRDSAVDLERAISMLKEDKENILKSDETILRIKAGLGTPIQLVFYTFSLSIIALPSAELLSSLFFGFLFIFFIIVLTLKTASEIIKFTLIALIN